MPTAEPRLDTPLMRQYKALKASYRHAILFFRLGDFYEMFGDDAKLASPVLGLILTSRQGVPMCGVPLHSAANYVAKLLKAGHKVAIAEQLEDPSKAKGLVQRKVIRLITPGTVIEDELLDASANNYLVAVELDRVGWGLACIEVSTGEFWATQALNDAGSRSLLSLLARLYPAEVLATQQAAEHLKLREALHHRAAITFFDRPVPADGAQALARGNQAEAAVWANRSLAAKAALKARAYVAEAQSHLMDLLSCSYREPHAELQLDETAIRTLELVTSSTGERRHSLWGVLDRCRTGMGSRKLRSWILHPLVDVAAIERRHNCVEELLEKEQPRRTLAQVLAEISDLERVVSRLTSRSASPRDLAALRDSLLQFDALRKWLAEAGFASSLEGFAELFKELAGAIEGARALLERALADRPPARLSDGGLIRQGFDRELDELRSIKDDSRTYLSALEASERASTGIGSLKVGFNSVFGYYIEVTRAHQAKVPQRYHRKQTLANAERYITPELKDLEAKILGAEGKIARLEVKLFELVRSEALGRHRDLLRFAACVAELDALASLAEAAHANDYVKPRVDLSHDLVIEDGRHPVVEAAAPAGAFVPNSISLDGVSRQILVITGANMSGKSTYLRQNALIAIMSQMGSFVPAASARVGLVDKVLTRIGAQDALSRNESTFMVEMRETSHILQTATPRSLIILDEVGRGTSTFDGISIAWAVLEHLNAAWRPRGQAQPGKPVPPLGPRTLFATHYFELTQLADLCRGVMNANVEAREWTNAEGKTEVVFLHKVSPGPADRSFGIHVAQLAGLPESCLSRARELLKDLENKSREVQEDLGRAEKLPAGEPMLPMFEEHRVLHELRLLEPDKLSPLEALHRIVSWKKSL